MWRSAPCCSPMIPQSHANKLRARSTHSTYARYPRINGSQAWQELQRIAATAEANHGRASDFVHAVLTDVEMPEMDGFILTKKIKSDPRFSDIPVIMHSSLSGMQNQHLGLSVGVDEYVSKFEPKRLAEVLRRQLTKSMSAKKPVEA